MKKKKKIKRFWKRWKMWFLSPWEPHGIQRWCCSLCLQFARSASSIEPGQKISKIYNNFFNRFSLLTSSSSQHKSLASMTSPSSKNSARMTKSNWASSSSILVSTFSWSSMSAVARPRSQSCWFWKTSTKVLWKLRSNRRWFELVKIIVIVNLDEAFLTLPMIAMFGDIYLNCNNLMRIFSPCQWLRALFSAFLAEPAIDQQSIKIRFTIGRVLYPLTVTINQFHI